MRYWPMLYMSKSRSAKVTEDLTAESYQTQLKPQFGSIRGEQQDGASSVSQPKKEEKLRELR